MLTVNKDKVWLYYDGDEDQKTIHPLVNEWYKDSPVYIKQVEKIKVNKMNKIIRAATY